MALIVAAFSVVGLDSAFTGDSQTPSGAAASPPQPSAPAVAPQAPPADQPGFLHQMKVWWDDSIAVLDDKIKDTRGKVDDLTRKSGDAAKGASEAAKGAAATATDAMTNAVEATKNAATAIVRLPNTRVVDVRETCASAANGAPDCAAAAASGCRGKGFATGKPLDVRSAEKCDTKPLQAGNLSSPLGCVTESVVTRAVCQ